MSAADLELELLRAAALLERDPAAAARAAGEILARQPTHAAASLLLATATRGLGDSAAALGVLENLAREQPASAVIALELARARVAAGYDAEAVATLRRVVELEPDLADGWALLSAQLARAGDPYAADSAYARYSQLTPDVPRILHEPAVALRENRPGAAEAMLRRHLLATPDDVAALRMLAEAVGRRGGYAEAEQLLLRCLELAPGFASARYDLAQLYLTQQKPALALPLAERLMRLDPDDLNYRHLEVQAYSLLGRHDRTIEALKSMVRDPRASNWAWIAYGHELKAAGRRTEAIDAYRRAIAENPTAGAAYSSLANLKTFRFEEAEVAAMRAALQRADLRWEDRVDFEFTLGKALEDSGQFAEAFAHYQEGSSLRRAGLNDTSEKNVALVRRACELYTRQFFADRADWGSEAVDPIFIVGLPRAGSTLLEQILASHPKVEGTRELAEITAAARRLGGTRGELDEGVYLESVAQLDRAQVRALADDYLEATRAYRLGGQPRFIDKMPNNFLHLGLIHLLFPRASIIDARRHPLGCCFSCFKQHFAKGQLFTYDLTELGRYYRNYVALMDHFDAVLPGRVHRVHYEYVVADFENEVRRLLAYCGLPFDERCLRFHENRRAVHTVSSEQVRRPIFSDGVAHWRHFEPWLGPLKNALGDVIERYPEVPGI